MVDNCVKYKSEKLFSFTCVRVTLKNARNRKEIQVVLTLPALPAVVHSYSYSFSLLIPKYMDQLSQNKSL